MGISARAAVPCLCLQKALGRAEGWGRQEHSSGCGETNPHVGGQDSRVLGEHAGGPWAGRAGLLPSALQTHAIAAGRSTAAHEAVCVEVLKTSAGLGLSLDGGKSSMAGDGPLLVKRVYKGNVLEKPVHCPLPVFCLHVSAFHLEIKFVFKSLPCFKRCLTSTVYCISSVMSISHVLLIHVTVI